jgi:hypothetical protein
MLWHNSSWRRWCNSKRRYNFFLNRRHSSRLDFVQLRWWRRKPWMGGFRRMLGCCHIIIIIGWRWMKRWTQNIINITIIDGIALYYIIGFVAYYNKVNTSFNTLLYRILSALIISAGQLNLITFFISFISIDDLILCWWIIINI